MKRRSFLTGSTLLGLSSLVLPSWTFSAQNTPIFPSKKTHPKQAKNIIFLVSDGMSMGTLSLADQFMRMKNGKSTEWISLYEKKECTRALMDTASLNSLVTDSAAGGSAWGCGYRVENGKINVGPNGERYTPILQKYKKAGKSVGCVTTVPITHATPASFCVNNEDRSGQDQIAMDYLNLRFDVMMGGGDLYFSESTRADKVNLYPLFESKGFDVLHKKEDFKTVLQSEKPVLGVFDKDALPYSIDNEADFTVPSLAEMTDFAINKLKMNKEGFVLQVEAGKVDWAAHANDTVALLNDQLAFDDAIGVALRFALEDENTLVVITTDHGNSNPGLLYGKSATENFKKVWTSKHSNEWILKGLTFETTPQQLIERIEFASNCVLSIENATLLKNKFLEMNKEISLLYNPYKLPFKELAQYQSLQTSVSWMGTNHTSDFVELCMIGPGSELLPAFIKNNQVHHFLLNATGLTPDF